MWFVLRVLLRLLRLTGRSRQDLILETLAVRHQIAVLERTARRPAWRDRDRRLWSLRAQEWIGGRTPLHIVPPLASAEITRLLAGCDSATPMGRRDRAILLTLLDTGIRCSEAAHLDLTDCRLGERRLLVRQGKGGKDRLVPFAARCADALAAYLTDRGSAPGPLFVAARNGHLRPSVRLRPNGLKQFLRRLGQAAGVRRVHAHRFRHTFATWAIAHNARELNVQHLLGHSSPDMVRRYSATYGSAQAAERHAAFSPGDQMLAEVR